MHGVQFVPSLQHLLFLQTLQQWRNLRGLSAFDHSAGKNTSSADSTDIDQVPGNHEEGYQVQTLLPERPELLLPTLKSRGVIHLLAAGKGDLLPGNECRAS